MAVKERSTIIIVPHAQGRVYKLQLSPRVLRAAAIGGVVLALLSVVSLVASGSFLRQRAVYKSLQKENRALRTNNQRLSETVAQVQTRLTQFEQRTRSLAIAAGISDLLSVAGDGLRPGVGSGGPMDALHSDAEAIMRQQEFLDRQLAKVEQKLNEQSLMLAHTPTVAPVIGVITDGFGPRLDPLTRRPAFHDGLDISAPIGTAVRAPADGIVVFSGRESGYGKMVKVSHGYGYVTLYAHLDRITLKQGDRVERGVVVGRVGMTGRTTGPHLHYEVWKDNEKQNPLHYILDAY